jgi:DNA-binding NarL/FixJ family response regulator
LSISVLLIEDHGVMRDGLRMLIDGQSDMKVVGELADGHDAVKRIRASRCDVVLLDLSLPGRDGIAVLKDLEKEGSRPPVVVLTMHDETRQARRALDAGAAGYLVKAAAASQVLDAIRTAYAGGKFVDIDLADPVDAKPARVGAPHDTLSPRELEVLRYVSAGHTNRETAERLGLSVKTVEGYRRRLARKLEAHNRADLVRAALTMGLLDDPV